MWLDRVSNQGPPTYESGALPIAQRGPATPNITTIIILRIDLFFFFGAVMRLNDADEMPNSVDPDQITVLSLRHT